MNAVFRLEDLVLRVSPAGVDVTAEVSLVRWLKEHGVPTLCPIADPFILGDVSVTVWDFLDGTTELDYTQFGAALCALHRLDPDQVADHVDLPWCGDSPWLNLEGDIAAAATTGVVSEDDIATLRAVGTELADWEQTAHDAPLVVCHGDVHPRNALMRGNGLVILDWDSICLGPTAWDHAAMLTWEQRWGGGPDSYEAFAAGYGIDMRGTTLGDLLARVRLLAATIHMIIKGAGSAHHAEEARLRMRYWKGEVAPPTWTPQ
jgi:Ser/Thr protein kinase RdoA (MazF antagonist)